MMTMSRKDKLDKVLLENIGEWLTASEILSKIGNKDWDLVGFSSARSLALFLKRYRFEKDGKKYYIEWSKVLDVEENPYQTKKDKKGGS